MEPTLTSEQNHIAYVLFGLSGLAGIVSTILSAWNALRRKPSIDVTLQAYVKREELDALDKRVDDLARQLFDRQREDTHLLSKQIDTLTERLTDWQKGVERQIGRIEGNCQAITSKRSLS
ncbi:MAG: hypothetical protein IJV69_02320 [Kiritimatiellae bacterium]|nr:hypothetical protein [Kiritimatiellia bacterium]